MGRWRISRATSPAVLDWEMATIDPLVDLAHHSRPWRDYSDPTPINAMMAGGPR